VIELGGIRLAEGRPIWLHAFGFGRYQHPEHGALEFTRARLGPVSDVGGVMALAEIGSDAHLVIEIDQGRTAAGPHARRTRLRSRSNFARPYICRLSILIRFTLPSTAPEL
jgi:hypothetical protein